jgi:hypothetical protein
MQVVDKRLGCIVDLHLGRDTQAGAGAHFRRDRGRRPPAQPGSRSYSLGNGDGQWPKPGTLGCSQPGAVALSLITAGQRDADVLATSRRACRQLTPERHHITWLVI